MPGEQGRPRGSAGTERSSSKESKTGGSSRFAKPEALRDLIPHASAPTLDQLHGVNLSGWLVLESWVTPSIFSQTGVFDERGLVESVGATRYAELVRRHRDSFMSERDFARISARGFDAVRLPVPWYVFGEDGPLPGSFTGCISYVDQAFDWAEASGLRILLDIAVAPAGSSMPDGRNADLGEFGAYRMAMLDVVGGLSARYAGRPAFLGIEPVDELMASHPQGLGMTEGTPLHRIRNYYRDAYEVVRQVAGEDPVVVLSDAGLPNAWKQFMAQPRYCNVWLDSHLYHYTDQMDASGPRGVRKLVERSIRSLDQARRSGLPVMVGEWSSALPLADSTMTPEGRLALERVYASGQLAAFKGTTGWFFQTWKTEGHLSSWDARIALSSFERGMFS